MTNRYSTSADLLSDLIDALARFAATDATDSHRDDALEIIAEIPTDDELHDAAYRILDAIDDLHDRRRDDAD